MWDIDAITMNQLSKLISNISQMFYPLLVVISIVDESFIKEANDLIYEQSSIYESRNRVHFHTAQIYLSQDYLTW